MKAGRIPCCVPFCGRTASSDKFPSAEEIICGKHWRMIPKAIRAHRRTLQRRFDRVDRWWNTVTLPRGGEAWVTAFNKYARARNAVNHGWHRNWARCKEEAITNCAIVGP